MWIIARTNGETTEYWSRGLTWRQDRSRPIVFDQKAIWYTLLPSERWERLDQKDLIESDMEEACFM
jgi:hypothetical protein